MVTLTQANARFERAHSELAAAAEDMRRLMFEAEPDGARTIICIVAAHFKVTPIDLIGAARLTGMVLPRHTAMAIIRRLLGQSHSRIGKHFGGRDRSSVIWAEKTVAARCDTEPEYRRRFEKVLAECAEALEAERATGERPSIPLCDASAPARKGAAVFIPGEGWVPWDQIAEQVSAAWLQFFLSRGMARHVHVPTAKSALTPELEVAAAAERSTNADQVDRLSA